jgi:hypothetical protein
MVDGCILIEIQHSRVKRFAPNMRQACVCAPNGCAKQMFDPHRSSTESGNTPWIQHEYTMNICYTHLRGRFPASFILHGFHLPRYTARFLDAQEQRRVGRIQWEDLVAYARACGGAGGVFSIASLILATGTDLRHWFSDSHFGVGWSLWPNQKGSNLPNERLNQSKISELSKTWGLNWLNQPKLGVNQPKIGMNYGWVAKLGRIVGLDQPRLLG